MNMIYSGSFHIPQLLHTAELWITHIGNDRSHCDGNQGTIISEVESHLAG